MSRYSLKPLPHRADLFEVAVGWDASLGTYFAIVFGTPSEDCEPEVLLWRGTSFGEIRDPGALLCFVRGIAEVSPDLVNILMRDMRASARGTDNPIIRAISAFLRHWSGGRWR